MLYIMVMYKFFMVITELFKIKEIHQQGQTQHLVDYLVHFLLPELIIALVFHLVILTSATHHSQYLQEIVMLMVMETLNMQSHQGTLHYVLKT